MACTAQNGGAEPRMGEQSPPLLAPRAAATRHAAHSLYCYAAQLEPCPQQPQWIAETHGSPRAGRCAPSFPPLLQPGRGGEQRCRPPAPRAVLHVEAQQVVQHRLPAGRKRTGTAAAADLQGREPSAPPIPNHPFPDPPRPRSAPLSSPRRPASPSPSGLPPALAPRPAGPSPVVPAEHVDGVPVRDHGVFAAPAGGTQRRSAALAAAAPHPAPPPRRSPGAHELVAGREAAPAVHRLEGPEVEGEVLDAVRAAVVEVHARSHLRAPRAARGGPGRRHGAASPAGLRLPACTATAAPGLRPPACTATAARGAAQSSAPDCGSRHAPRGVDRRQWVAPLGARSRVRGPAAPFSPGPRHEGAIPAPPAPCERKSEAVSSVKSFYSLIQKNPKN